MDVKRMVPPNCCMDSSNGVPQAIASPNLVKQVIKYGTSAVLASCLAFSTEAFANIQLSSQSLFGVKFSANTFVFSPRTHRWKAINSKGKVIRSGRASGGRNYCPDIKRSCRTPSGTFYVRSKGGPGCKSSRYPLGKGGAPMPYCMFYSRYYAIHGSYDVPNYNASHGCIRVTPSDARWLSKHFIRIGTKVIVKSY